MPTSAPLNVAWDWTGIVGTGQSLSVGWLGTPMLATEQRYNNLKLDLGDATVPPFDATLSSLKLVPLTEPIRPIADGYPSAYPANIYGETPHTAMAEQMTALALQQKVDFISIHTVVGESGQVLSVILKNPTDLPTTGTSGRAYDATLFEASAIKRIADRMGKTYGIGAIVLTHGETDTDNTAYESGLYRLASDYNRDLAAITGQTVQIPLLVSQQHSLPVDPGSVSLSALAVWKAGMDHPGEIVCTGPKYQYSYAVDPHHLHLSAQEYDRLGEKVGQVYFERAVLGHDWQPLQPTTAEVSGNVVTVHFHAPVPPLVWDDTLPAPHGAMIPEWANGRGFEVTWANIRQTIEAVEIIGDDTVEITCHGDLSNGAVVVGYAATAEGVTPPAAQTARWGQLRDSDPFVGAVTNMPQPNYSVAFQITVH